MSFIPSNETVNSGFIFKGRCRYLRTHIHLNKMFSNAASGQVYLILAGRISDKHLHVGDSKLMVLVRNSDRFGDVNRSLLKANTDSPTWWLPYQYQVPSFLSFWFFTAESP